LPGFSSPERSWVMCSADNVIDLEGQSSLA
jgi:hypothetical protein